MKCAYGMAVVMLGIVAGRAVAEIERQRVTPDYLRHNPGQFSIQIQPQKEELVLLTVTRHLAEPRYLSSTLEVRDGEKLLVRSTTAAAVTAQSVEFQFTLHARQLQQAKFMLGESGSAKELGGTTYVIELADFAKRTGEQQAADLGLVEVEKISDSVDTSRVIRFTGKAGKVDIRPGETSLVELPPATRTVEWTAGDAPEKIGDPELGPFTHVQCKWDADGRLEWRLYRRQ